MRRARIGRRPCDPRAAAGVPRGLGPLGGLGAVGVAAAIGGGAGCGGPAPMVGFDGGPIVRSLTAQQIVAYEGMTRFVTVIDSDGATDLTGASVSPQGEGSPLVVRESVCSAAACAVQLEILDLTSPRAVPIPRPIDAQNHFLRVDLAGEAGEERQVLVTVWPLDTISNSGTPSRVQGAIFASSASSEPGGTFQGMAGEAPIRWLVMGDARLEGALDVSGLGVVGHAGGGAGAAIGEAASGAGGEPATGGGAGGALSGGGGGGGAEPGTAGAGAAGGTAGEAVAACATDFAADACGGAGGGGGAAAEGGAGGGTILIAALGRLTIAGGATARGAAGADGEGAGGGGGGGQIVLAGSEVIIDGSLDVSGGAGGMASSDAEGGAGGPGSIRIDTLSVPSGITGASGVAFDVAGADLIVDQASYVIRGRGPAGAAIEIDAIDRPGVAGEATAGADGAFEITVTLEPGLNRLRLRADGARAWNGTSFESERVGGATMPQPVGGVLDVAYVPAG